MHVLTPAVFEILEGLLTSSPSRPVTLSSALALLAKRERYLALEVEGWRYNIGVKYGLLMAQLALALSGHDRDQLLSELVELLATTSPPSQRQRLSP
jgi:UTP--glucose-1-phosphate uridylyltransferase